MGDTKQRILLEEEAQVKIAEGVDIIAACVGATMGPGGQVVAIETGWRPMTTKDGVTVARSVELSDKFQKLGADLVKAAAEKTNEVAGDGTTATTVLTRAIYREGRRRIAAGENPVHIKQEIDRDTAVISKNLLAAATPVETLEKLEHVATISANDATLGKAVAGIMHEAGKDGFVTLEESPTFGVETEMTRGMKLDAGYAQPFMVTNAERMTADVQDCPVLVTDRKITTQEELLPLFQKMSEKGWKKLFIVCDGIEGIALAFLFQNSAHFKTYVVKAPGLGNVKKAQLADICAYTGATFISDELGKSIKETTLDMLGSARKVSITRDTTIIVDGAGKQEDVDSRIAAIKTELETTTNEYDREKLKERLGRLTGSVGVIKIGGANDVEIKERKQRVEDAVNATRAAQSEGIVIGGGCALVFASLDLPANAIMRLAAEYPLRTIAENAGKNGDVVLEHVLNAPGGHGYNAATDKYEDLVLAGVIDPVFVTRTALSNAASIAGLLLTTKAAIVVEEEKK